MKTILSIFMLLACVYTQAQPPVPSAQFANFFPTPKGEFNFSNEFDFEKFANKTSLKASEYTKIQGSPYLDEKFQEGAIFTKDSVLYSGLKLRYNAYNEVLEFQKNDIAFRFNKNISIVEAKIGNKIFEKKSFLDKQYVKNGYFQRIHKDYVSLYIKQQVSFQPTKPEGIYKSSAPACFKKHPPKSYLGKKEHKILVKIVSLKDALDFFSDKQDEIKKYIRKNKLKPKKESDLLQIVKYYNSLINKNI